MYTIEEYDKLYPNGCYLIDRHVRTKYQPRTIMQGLLVFTEESSSIWAGPFPGNTAYIAVVDFSTHLYGGKTRDKDRLYLEVLEEKYADKLDPKEDPSFAKPYKVYIGGSDDTSYSKFYSSEKEAMDEVNLFAGNEPLDALELIQDFGFFFSN